MGIRRMRRAIALVCLLLGCQPSGVEDSAAELPPPPTPADLTGAALDDEALVVFIDEPVCGLRIRQHVGHWYYNTIWLVWADMDPANFPLATDEADNELYSPLTYGELPDDALELIPPQGFSLDTWYLVQMYRCGEPGGGVLRTGRYVYVSADGDVTVGEAESPS